MNNGKLAEDTQDVSFLLDGMLGSLARKLRIMGFDTVYDPKSEDLELLRKAESTRRCLVTSDIALYIIARRRRINSILVASRTESGRICELLTSIGESKINEERETRCSLCNGELAVLGKRENGRDIFACKACGKEYWKGNHWKKLELLFREVNVMLQEKSGSDSL